MKTMFGTEVMICDDNEEVVYNLTKQLEKKCPMILTEYAIIISNVIFDFITLDQAMNQLEIKVGEINKDDKKREELYLSGGMGRLAMSEFNDSYKDAPQLECEIKIFKELCKELLQNTRLELIFGH